MWIRGWDDNMVYFGSTCVQFHYSNFSKRYYLLHTEIKYQLSLQL